MSHELIEHAMREVRPGRALVLGAGACREIPLVALAARFEAVTLVDENAADLATAIALLPTGSKANDASMLQDVIQIKEELERIREQVENLE